MQEFYSPKPENKGAALFVSALPEDQTIVFSLVKQTSYDPQEKIGGFKGGKRINVNLSLDEVGSIIDAVRNKKEFPIFHTYADKPTATGKFSYYSIDGANGAKKTGFGLSIKKDDVDYRIGFTHGSAEKLAQYLSFCLVKCFEVDLAADLVREREWQEKKKNNPKPTPKEVAPEPEQPAEPAENQDW